jgi:hypothetical protein
LRKEVAETTFYNLAIIWFGKQEKTSRLFMMTFDYFSIVRFLFYGVNKYNNCLKILGERDLALLELVPGPRFA